MTNKTVSPMVTFYVGLTEKKAIHLGHPFRDMANALRNDEAILKPLPRMAVPRINQGEFAPASLKIDAKKAFRF
ncbi:MAG TPA: hypothetical protein PLI90_07995 [Rhodocyclaceae bacterium]|nr:hypothetical protein [Rhodocyclaceae bacterium]